MQSWVRYMCCLFDSNRLLLQRTANIQTQAVAVETGLNFGVYQNDMRANRMRWDRVRGGTRIGCSRIESMHVWYGKWFLCLIYVQKIGMVVGMFVTLVEWNKSGIIWMAAERLRVWASESIRKEGVKQIYHERMLRIPKRDWHEKIEFKCKEFSITKRNVMHSESRNNECSYFNQARSHGIDSG